MKPNPVQEMLTSQELAALLNVSLRFIEKNREYIPGAIKIGRVWRFRRYEIERAMDSGQLLTGVVDDKAKP